MKLFTVGPVDMSDDIKKCGGEQIPYFRTMDFSNIMLQIENIYLKMIKAPLSSRLITLTASGTGAMEASVLNLLTKNDKVLIIDGGSFGHRFVELCQRFGIPFESIYLSYGEALRKEQLVPYENKGFTALLVNLHETSTGQLYDGYMLGDFCERNDMLYISDAISTLFADPFDMESMGINAVICASQKALALPPGLSFIAVDQRAQDRIASASVSSLYFDLKDYLKNMERGQTPFTPAVGIIIQLHHQLLKLSNIGIDSIVEEHAHRAAYFRDLCMQNSIHVAEFPKSNALTTIEFPDNNAYDVFLKMKEKYNIMLTPNGGDLAKRVLRVGHLGERSLEDYDDVINYLKEVLA